MKRSAVLRDVPHGELEGALGNFLETGWTVHHAYPSSEFITTSGASTELGSQSSGSRMVTHWTIFLETEITHPTEVPG